jgi:hypothetical protein
MLLFRVAEHIDGPGRWGAAARLTILLSGSPHPAPFQRGSSFRGRRITSAEEYPKMPTSVPTLPALVVPTRA